MVMVNVQDAVLSITGGISGLQDALTQNPLALPSIVSALQGAMDFVVGLATVLATITNAIITATLVTLCSLLTDPGNYLDFTIKYYSGLTPNS
ncbi:hypothetical protein CEXT_531721 [Caerostris extrusa]|uniref:Uncharacterized protein n=1 Tax=Caerostris extrusa TaxID=172846 RepID=A0AAV4SZD7_CAEEX|nr:hypothetical protein CEXT_531721 [Caerostris extrusa]